MKYEQRIIVVDIVIFLIALVVFTSYFTGNTTFERTVVYFLWFIFIQIGNK